MVTELQAAPETATLGIPDTAATETVEAPELTLAPVVEATEPVSDAPGETEPEGDPLASYTAEQVRNSPLVKSLLEAHARDVKAGVEGAHKQALEAERAQAEQRAAAEAYQRNIAEMNAVEHGKASDDLVAVLEEVTGAADDPYVRERLRDAAPKLGAIAETLQRAAAVKADRQAVEATNAYLTQNYPDYRVPPELVTKFDAALAKGDFTTRHNLLMQLAGDAREETVKSSMRAELAKQFKADAEKELALERSKVAETAASSTTRPTTAQGRPAQIGNYTNLQEVAAAHMRGELTNAQVRSFRAMPRDQMPEF